MSAPFATRGSPHVRFSMLLELLAARPLSASLAVVALAPPAFCQATAVPITAPVRDAGIFHAETRTWTRYSSQATLGADIVYNNSCFTGYFFPLGDDTLIDEGRLPSPSGPTNVQSRPGCAAAYTIDGLQIGYCTDAGPNASLTFDFYQSYVACSSVIGRVPTASVVVPMPSVVTGALSCWIATIDLGTSAFTLLADGDGAYTGNSTENLFGWAVRTDATTGNVGPFIAGAMQPTPDCTRYDGTRWDDGPAVPFWPNNIGEPGTGMGTLDQFRLEGGISPPGCYFGSGNLLRSFHLVMYADACSPPTGLGFCAGDGSASSCPCGNSSAPGSGQGCLNSSGVGSGLTVAGVASLAADTIVLLGSHMPTNSSALFLQGTLPQNGGLGSSFGDGLRCAGGALVRLGVASVNAGGNASYPNEGDQRSISVRGHVSAPGVRVYQVWYRNAAPFCTPAGFNLSNGWSLTWAP